MDHSKLHKDNAFRRTSETRTKENVKRRSLAQKERRDGLLDQRRNLSPLRESTNNVPKKQSDIRSRLAKWQQERDLKKKKEKAKQKPIFKVQSIQHKDEILLKKKTEPAKISQPASKPIRKHVYVPSRISTRSSKAAQKEKINKDKPSEAKKGNKIDETKKVQREKKEVPHRATRTTRQSKRKQVEEEEKEDKVTQSQPSPEKEVEETEKIEETPIKEEEVPSTSEDQKPAERTNIVMSESFAPLNFTFQAPQGLFKFPSTPMFPKSSGPSTSKNGNNFMSSTPNDHISTVSPIKPAPVPLILTSTSGSSSDECKDLKDVFHSNKVNENDKSDEINDLLREDITKEDEEEEVESEMKKDLPQEDITEQNRVKDQNVTRFRNLVVTETDLLNKDCKSWEEILNASKEELNEEVIGEIRTMIGQAQLLMAERFKQFSELVDKFETPSPDHNLVTETDLDGFWEMIYYQVDDVRNKFKELNVLKENKWEKEEEEKKTQKKRKASRRKSTKTSTAHRQAAKKRLQEAREAMKKRKQEEEDVQKLEEDFGMNISQEVIPNQKKIISSQEEIIPKLEDEKIENTFEDEAAPKEDVNKPSSNLETGGIGFLEDSLIIPSKRIAASSSSEQDVKPQEGRITRSRKKTPHGKNVSFVTPRSKKRKARFDTESSETESETPGGSQPRKRVMRKTPLPSMRKDSLNPETTTASDTGTEDGHGSPTLKTKTTFRHSLISDGDPIPDDGETSIAGLKLNFDSIEDEEEEAGIDPKYLMPASTMSPRNSSGFPTPQSLHSSPLNPIYLMPSSETPVFSNSPKRVIHGTSSSFGMFGTPGKSPGRVLKNKRKSVLNPMSPFMGAKSNNSSMNDSSDLMSFSPVVIKKVSDNTSNEIGTVTKFAAMKPSRKVKENLGTDLIFSPVRRSARILSHIDSCGETSQQTLDTLKECIENGTEFGYLPNPMLARKME